MKNPNWRRQRFTDENGHDYNGWVYDGPAYTYEIQRRTALYWNTADKRYKWSIYKVIPGASAKLVRHGLQSELLLLDPTRPVNEAEAVADAQVAEGMVRDELTAHKEHDEM